MNTKTCIVQNCNGTYYAMNLCSKCYQRWYHTYRPMGCAPEYFAKYIMPADAKLKEAIRSIPTSK